MPKPEQRPGDSRVQREAEGVIREALAERLGVKLAEGPSELGLQLDAFAEGPPPVCAEIWAHQGRAKSAQKAKVMADMCKLLLCERLLGKPCRKFFAVSDELALAFLQNSWQGRFADEFGIERIVVQIPAEVRARIAEAQRKQYR